MEQRTDFYVYAHTRATDGSIFYIGKGHGKRAWSKSRSSYWKNTVAKYGYNVLILLNGLTEEQSFILEKQLILSIGRNSLVNLTDGGEGPSGCIHTEESRRINSESKKGLNTYPRSEEHKRKLSEVNMGKKLSLETRKKMSESRKGIKYGPRSEDAKMNMSNSQKGKKLSEETKLKMSQSKKGVKKPPRSEEHKRKLSEAQKGKKRSPETTAKRLATRAANLLLKQSQN